MPAVAGRASAMTAAASNMLKANASRFVKVFSFNSVCPARYCAGHEWLISATPCQFVKSGKSKPKMGRPVTTGIGVPVLLRMHDPQLSALDAWIAAQNEPISRPEGARRLIEMALEGARKGKGR